MSSRRSAQQSPPAATQEAVARPAAGRSLVWRIVALAIAFVALTEMIILVPAMARFRVMALEERMASARLAILALDAAPDRYLPQGLERTLLDAAGARAITIWRPDAELMLGHMGPVEAVFDLREQGSVGPMVEAVRLLLDPDPGLIRVVAPAPAEPGAILDVALDQVPLRDAMLAYSGRIVNVSLTLTAVVALLLVFSLQRMIVRPLAAITRRIDRFRLSPEDGTADPPPGDRGDEIGIVERELARMQGGLRLALAQKERLAALGATVSQLTHDLRNMLATAVLISDRLEQSADPAVRRVAPRLVGSLDRAVRLCEDTLTFARDRPQPLALGTILLRPLVDEAAAEAVEPAPGARVLNEVAPDLMLVADRDQLYRVLLNLLRNGCEAAGSSAAVRCHATIDGGAVVIEVTDNGPGIPPERHMGLFQSFGLSAKAGGSGLGLAICRAIMRAHGGEIVLAGTGPEGSRFRLTLPVVLRPGAAGAGQEVQA